MKDFANSCRPLQSPCYLIGENVCSGVMEAFPVFSSLPLPLLSSPLPPLFGLLDIILFWCEERRGYRWSDWQLEHRYPGLAPSLRRLKQLALDSRQEPLTLRVRLLEEVLRAGLEHSPIRTGGPGDR